MAFFFLCVVALVLGSLSLLSHARQRTNLESWLGGHGLVGEWVVTGCVQHHPPTKNISLLNHARQRKNLVLRWLGVLRRGGGGVINILRSIKY